jgi:CRP-like cAMP-binding protein
MATSQVRTEDFLARLPLFSSLAPAELTLLASGTTEQQLERGAMLFHRGEPCTGFHTVVFGQIKLMLVSPMGVEKVVRVIEAGDSFGEALMFLDKPYIVSAQALCDSLVLHVSKAVLLAEMERQPQLARKMLASLSQRLHNLMSDVEAYSLRSGTQRVIGYFMQGGDDLADGHQFRLPTSKTIIASRLNLTPEHFSRILHDLADNGLIQVKGRDITLLNVQALSTYSG